MLLVMANLHLDYGVSGLRDTTITLPGVSDLGLADSSGEQIGCRPPRPAGLPYARAGFCQDRFLRVSPGHTRSLAKVEVKEELVYDGKFRADIAFVGVGVALTLREDAFRSYCDFLGRAAADLVPNTPFAPLRVVIRLPIRPFRFPPSRGSDTPWETPIETLSPLRTMAREDINAVDFVLLEDRKYLCPSEGEVPRAAGSLLLRGAPVKKGPIARTLSAWFGQRD